MAWKAVEIHGIRWGLDFLFRRQDGLMLWLFFLMADGREKKFLVGFWMNWVEKGSNNFAKLTSPGRKHSQKETHLRTKQCFKCFVSFR